MKCTVLLLALMVCTVSFIYGTQSDNVLKEATGNDPWLPKTRNSNKKYGPFRKTLTSESIRHTEMRDAPLSPPEPPVPHCTYRNQVCNELARDNYGRSSTRNICKCQGGQNAKCSERWDNDEYTLSWIYPTKDRKQVQWKFCRKLKNDNCESGQTAGISSKYKNNWTYTSKCKCHANYAELDQMEQTNGVMKKWHFVCSKPKCSFNKKCMARFTQSGGGKRISNFTHICVCSWGQTCRFPDPELDIVSDGEGEFSSSTSSNCK